MHVYLNFLSSTNAVRCFFALSFLVCTCTQVAAQKLNIKNDAFWDTTDGRPIYSQGGGVFRFKDPGSGKEKYYWYGVHYKEAETYRNSPNRTLPQASFESVTCYTSVDLVSWTFEAEAMTKAEALPDGKWNWVGRLGVAFVKEIDQYAMFVQHGSEVLIALSDVPAGPFKWHQKISMLDRIGTTNTGDQTVFTDEDTGKSYLVYSYGRGRHKIYVSEIGMKNGKVDLLDCTKIFEGASREGNCMFKYKGKFYMAASNIYGWDGSLAYYLVADDVRGPYRPHNEMLVMEGAEKDYAHVSQTGFFVTLKGSKQETVVYCGDRWANFAGNGLGYNVWVPLSFNGDRPYFNSLSSWNLDARTGEWEVAKDNNYVKNGSFEADRKRIPSVVKPVQMVLTGWETRVLKGNEISLDSLVSPALNYFNTEEDRLKVSGEKSLQISDVVDFERNVSQVISSSPYFKLPDGFYNLKAVIRNTDGFSVLEVYAESGGKRQVYKIEGADSDWKAFELKRIPIRNGTVEIGFRANGRGGASCQVDDVSLTLLHIEAGE
ncbi:glycosyl hydrolase family 43 [Arcticibacter pallidicorallinus]|uniref:Glycosyl hydrolase family 43 n=1 Tax=Arcticibacter pallidicorallinus TaxID=1259464 RepID=A0A2T0UB19_9SPHI|nr:family 43 glycosylhydrolase [Arcticibacter pallidicorallinus]PRY55136.1 glycosyl hydrolase family 43 [Arcticibacter pallidicorallinus]